MDPVIFAGFYSCSILNAVTSSRGMRDRTTAASGKRQPIVGLESLADSLVGVLVFVIRDPMTEA